MGWAIGWDGDWQRDIGYGVPAWCDDPSCNEEIDRGLSYVCGNEPYGGDRGCGLYMCGHHLYMVPVDPDDTEGDWIGLCARCHKGEAPFEPKPDHPEWLLHKLKDESWEEWRKNHPSQVEQMWREVERQP